MAVSVRVASWLSPKYWTLTVLLSLAQTTKLLVFRPTHIVRYYNQYYTGQGAEIPDSGDIQYVHCVMHKCIMVKLGEKRKTQKVCKST